MIQLNYAIVLHANNDYAAAADKLERFGRLIASSAADDVGGVAVLPLGAYPQSALAVLFRLHPTAPTASPPLIFQAWTTAATAGLVRGLVHRLTRLPPRGWCVG